MSLPDQTVAKTTASKPTALKFYLGEDDFDGQVLVSLESFLLFDNEMTHDLDQLERRWSDYSTRNSKRRDAWANWERI